MVYAHMDRVGMIVSFVTEDGFLRLQAIGGVPDKVLPGSRVLVRTVSGAWQYGVVGTKCNHPVSYTHLDVYKRQDAHGNERTDTNGQSS